MQFDVCFNFFPVLIWFYSFILFSISALWPATKFTVVLCACLFLWVFFAHNSNRANGKKQNSIRWKCSFYRYDAFWHWLNHAVTRTYCSTQDIDHGQFVSSAIRFFPFHRYMCLTLLILMLPLLLSRSHAIIIDMLMMYFVHPHKSAPWAKFIVNCLHMCMVTIDE